MQPQNPDYAAQVQRIIEEAVFVGHVGIHYADCGPGWCETRLLPAPELMQQDGFLHAGVLATMADHTAWPSCSGHGRVRPLRPDRRARCGALRRFRAPPRRGRR